jgi:glycine/D-amino acid oxidase-like deaminating enzyme
VAPEPRRRPALEALHRRALANGSPAVLIDEKELAELEPGAVTSGRALALAAHGAVVDPRAVLASIARELTEGGRARIRYGCRVIGPAGAACGTRTLTTALGPVSYGRLLNCAGAHADTLAHAFGLGRRWAMVPFKGLYRKLRPRRAALERGNVYPVPDPRVPFLGVHFTRGVTGEVYIGPTATPALGRENYGLLRGWTPRPRRSSGAARRCCSATPVPGAGPRGVAQILAQPLLCRLRPAHARPLPRRHRALPQGRHPAPACGHRHPGPGHGFSGGNRRTPPCMC